MKPSKFNPLNFHASITAAFSVALFSCFTASSAFSATRFWDGGTVDILTNGDGAASSASGTWNTTLLNWDAGAAPHVAWNNAANDTAEFNGGTNTITLGADVTVGRINQKGGASGINIAEGAGFHSITLGSATTIFNVAASTTSGRTMSVTAEVTGGNNLRIEGPGTTAGGVVNLNRVNTFTGSILVTQTTLRIGNAGAAGQLNSGNYTNTIAIGTNASFVYGSSLDQTLGGVISGAGPLVKNSSPSTLTLTAANTHSGSITLNAGTLALSGTGSVNSSSGITVNGSGAKFLQSSSVAVSPVVTLTNGTLTGNGTVNTVNVGDATGGIVSNNNGVAGASLTIGTLTFNGAAAINTFGNSSPAIATTTLATNALGLVTINPTAASWTTGSTYDLISYGGGSVGGAGFAQFAVGTVTGKSARQTATLIDTGSAIAVQIGGTTDFPYWVGDTDTQWDTTTSNNWKLFTAGTHTNFIPTDDVLFNDNATGAGPITVNIDAADVAATTTTFDNSIKDYVLNSSGSLFGVSAGSLTKNGTKNVTFGTANTTTGTTTVNNGTLSQTGGTATAVTTVINNGTLSQSGGTATAGTLQIGGNSAAPGTTAALTLTGGSFSATTFDVLSSRDNMVSNLTIGGAAAVTLPAFPTNAKGAGATATLTFDSTTGYLSPVVASTTYLPAGTFNNAYLTANGAKLNVPTGKGITIGQMLENAVSPAASGTLTKDGVGALILSGANTYTGTTTINEGTLSLGNASALGGTSAVTMATGTVIRPTIAGPVTLTAPITTSGAVTIGTPTVALGNQAFNEFILNGGIGGSGDVTFNNTNNINQIFTVTLGATCSYSGTTLLDNTAGTAGQIIVKLGLADALPTTTVVTIDGGTGAGSGRYAEINLNGFNQTLAGLTNTPRTDRVQRIVNSDVSAAATLTINNTSDYTFSGSLGVNGANGSVSSITMPGSTNGSNFGLTKSGSGTFTLGGNNPFQGATRISSGILSLGNNLALQRSALDTLNSIAGDAANGLQTTVTTPTLGGLTGNKNLADVFTTTAGGYSAVTALTLNSVTGASHSYSGAIANGAAGMTLTKSGAGTQTLSGSNTYTGATTVSAGTLALVGGSQTSPITVNNLASLGFTLGSGTTSTSAVTFDVGSTVKITGTPVPATSYTLMTTTATISGDPDLDPLIPGFDLLVDGTNTLKLVPVAVGGYAAWQSANSTAQTADLDHDNDGVTNGVEFFIGGTTNTTGFTSLPGVNTVGGLSVTWAKHPTYTGGYGSGHVVETSATLAGPWATEPDPGPTISFPSANEVKYTFPTPLGTKNFARLKVTP